MSVDSPSVVAVRENLVVIMSTLGWSQSELARKSGISQVHINRILRAKVVPSLDLVDQLAQAMGVTAERLIHEPAARTRKNSAAAS